MNDDIGHGGRSLFCESGDQVRRNLELDLGIESQASDLSATDVGSVVDNLETAIRLCAREGIPLPLVLSEVESALTAIPDDIPVDRHSSLRLHLVDYVTAAFAKSHLQSSSQ
ncbi:hypothetical protein ACFWUP_25925 [Nocardia sp. NPDC058658]|uniref:hypothetical protein n=1 Tax=Nocardia sp. NPDC058658 TaxID=3346580 RepID=UPI003665C408